MAEIKVQCACGAKYKFDVEPVNERMPGPVQCPSCGADGTEAANAYLMQIGSAAAAPARGSGLRLARAAQDAPEEAVAPPAESAVAEPAVAEAGGLLSRTTFIVKERVAVLKLTDTYDILDPATSAKIGVAKEEPPGWAKFLRLIVNKQMLPTHVNFYEQDGAPPVLSIRRGFTLFRSKIQIVSGRGESLGYFQSKLISVGGGFNVFDKGGQQVAQVKGNWKGWDFRFLTKSGREIGTVSKKWAGLGKELFTSADTYVIALTDLSGASPVTGALLLAAGLAIDTVFKEK